MALTVANVKGSDTRHSQDAETPAHAPADGHCRYRHPRTATRAGASNNRRLHTDGLFFLKSLSIAYPTASYPHSRRRSRRRLAIPRLIGRMTCARTVNRCAVGLLAGQPAVAACQEKLTSPHPDQDAWRGSCTMRYASSSPGPRRSAYFGEDLPFSLPFMHSSASEKTE